MTATARHRFALLRPCATLDLRSLALLRVGLALILLVDAALRLCDAGLLYADAGLYPRVLAVTIGDPARLSLYLLNGSAAFAALLTMLQGLAALAMLIGWRTRSATVLCWLLVVSASARNPLVVTQADWLLQALLLWGAFLPWQARWSIDRANEPRQDHAHLSWATVALLMQVFVIALCAAADTGFAPVARVAAGLVAVLLLAPAALARRGAAILVLILCGSGLALGSDGLLCWAGLVLGLGLIDGGVWDRLVRRLTVGQSTGDLRLYHHADVAGAARILNLIREFLILPKTQVLAAQASPRVERLLVSGGLWLAIDRDDTAHLGNDALRLLLDRSLLLRPLRSLLGDRGSLGARLERWMRISEPGPIARTDLAATPTAQRIVAVLAVLMLAWNLGVLGGVSPLAASPMKLLGLDQRWDLGTRAPGGWLVLVGERADGREIEALRGAEPDYSQPAEILRSAARNRAYLAALSAAGAQPYLETLADRLCRLRNHEREREDATRVARLRIVQVLSATRDSAETEQRVLWRQDCA
ncbi:MAG: hypothetical protein ACT4QA_17335 [Panacagrimonas sp.]